MKMAMDIICLIDDDDVSLKIYYLAMFWLLRLMNGKMVK
jgi:hypothetical protein